MTPLMMIAAVAENGVIGRDNALPWRLKSDLAGFREATLGKPLVMGRKTFDSLGRPLPKRLNIVLSRDPDLKLPGAVVVGSIEAALAVAHADALRSGLGEIAIIGGAALYEALIGRASRLLITHVHASPAGDAAFPAIDSAQFEEVARREVEPGPEDDHAYSVVDYRRRLSNS
jgi:dihydrofolate reductase